jgi:hypothetical protein
MACLDSISPLGGVAEPSCHRQSSVTKSPERILVLPVLECRRSMKTLNLKFAHFLVWMAFSLLGSIAFIVGFVVLIDPYALYGIVNTPGLNSVKPGLSRYQKEIKLTHAIGYGANSFILGNSRAEIGFDPDAPAFSEYGARAYNLAIPGTGIATARQQLEYLSESGIRPATILVGLEFMDFVAAPIREPVLHAVPHQSDKRQASLRFWWFDTLFSISTVKDAVRTLRIQHDDEAQTTRPNGFNPLSEYRAVARIDGYHAMFRHRAEESAGAYLKKAPGILSAADFVDLQVLLDISARSGADIKLIIYPYHAQILALFEETGLWPTFEEWKSRLVAEVSTARRRNPKARITLMDFSGFGYYNCERIPAKNTPGAVTQWYWEAGHFKKELGNILLNQVLFPSTAHMRVAFGLSSIESKFGYLLDSSNFAMNKKRIAAERQECVHSYPELFSETRDIVKRVRGKMQQG